MQTFAHNEYPATATAAVSCRNLTKIYGAGPGAVYALDDVNLDVQSGELTLLVGPSGCGKTTLLSVVAGILDPSQGEVAVMGVDLAGLSKREKVTFRGQNIGFVFQQFNLLPALSAVENVAVPGIILGHSRRAAIAHAAEVLDTMGMGDRLDSLPQNLSGGQQQRVAIARALSHEPSLLVCDEPTSALDAHNGHLIMELLRGISTQSNRAVVVVTHDSRVFEFGDRIAYMDDGRIVRTESRHVGQGKP